MLKKLIIFGKFKLNIGIILSKFSKIKKTYYFGTAYILFKNSILPLSRFLSEE